MKKESSKKPKFGKFYPQDNCDMCYGIGEVDDELVGGLFSTYHYTKKKCLRCNGTGKNIWTCLVCNEKMFHGNGMACLNLNCKMYNLVVLLADKGKE